MFTHFSTIRYTFDAYQTLGVSRDFSASELRTKWKQKVRECHPDRGGTNQAMADVSQAYKILSDPKMRKLYDRFGDKAIEIFKRRRPFRPKVVLSPRSKRRNNRERSRSPKPKRKAKKIDLKSIIQIKLADAYNGRTKHIRVRFEEECTVCCKNRQVCPFCCGHGRFADITENDTQVWKDCKHCNATGVKQKKSCANCIVCQGKGKVPKKRNFEVVIEPGMANHQTMVVQMENITAAITLQIRKHRTFQRVKNDLIFTKKITLKESLFGVPPSVVKTLDCRDLSLQSMKFKTVKPSHAYCIPREGMPIFRENGRRGDMYIKFVVEFPKQLGPEDAMLFERLNGFIKICSSLADMTIESPEQSGPGQSGPGAEEHSPENPPYLPVQPDMIYRCDLKKQEDLSSTNPDHLVIRDTSLIY